jgi:hypothetical protein
MLDRGSAEQKGPCVRDCVPRNRSARRNSRTAGVACRGTLGSGQPRSRELDSRGRGTWTASLALRTPPGRSSDGVTRAMPAHRSTAPDGAPRRPVGRPPFMLEFVGPAEGTFHDRPRQTGHGRHSCAPARPRRPAHPRPCRPAPPHPSRCRNRLAARTTHLPTRTNRPGAATPAHARRRPRTNDRSPLRTRDSRPRLPPKPSDPNPPGPGSPGDRRVRGSGQCRARRSRG